MAFEIFNPGPAKPERIEALLGVMTCLGEAAGLKDLERLLMPGVPAEQREMVRENLDAAQKLGLVEESEADHWRVTEGLVPTGLPLRRALQKRILSARQEGDDHFRFCQFQAWQIASVGRPGQAEIGGLSSPQLAQEFTRRVRSADTDLAVNATKASNSMEWAVYLGLGYRLGGGTGTFPGNYFPCPAGLVADSLDDLMGPQAELLATVLVARLAEAYPLLDQGELQGTLPPELRGGTTLSPGLSVALRLLHDVGTLTLVPAEDAPDSLQLWPDSAHPVPGPVHRIQRLQTSGGVQ